MSFDPMNLDFGVFNRRMFVQTAFILCQIGIGWLAADFLRGVFLWAEDEDGSPRWRVFPIAGTASPRPGGAPPPALQMAPADGLMQSIQQASGISASYGPTLRSPHRRPHQTLLACSRHRRWCG